MSTIISIISKETIPNISFINQFHHEENYYIFYSTIEMEKKEISKNIINACRLDDDKCEVVIIDSENALLILEGLENSGLDKEEKYLVNITGGTKIMSQMIFSFFYNFPNSVVYYLPIFSDIIQILHPAVSEIKLTFKINLKNYFYAYGFEIVESGDKFKNYSIKPSLLFNGVISNNGASKVADIQNALDKEYKGEDKSYLCGGWFEEFLYTKIKNDLDLKHDEIAFNVKIKNLQSKSESINDNEIDIAFIYKNRLNIIECKVYLSDTVKSDKYTQPMYKVSAISNILGFACKSHVAILGHLPNNKNVETRIEDLKKSLKLSNVFSIEDFKNIKSVINAIKSN